ncbi:uncharacterized protein N0V89_008282 [Didymosphaeria variabile]|uniref:DUF7587 domain-containing protein n=1 Tax=Didymosphaeria variabile TaxID=1932322 RepID=A0A9W8XFN4_9PLEO|nr:uncharacterized protein N0V89_008282 [Didymosphaeria variabile]KAJ4349665.1 hypothetical protein N0V89_008282 [Didymosphaeria variabile]
MPTQEETSEPPNLPISSSPEQASASSLPGPSTRTAVEASTDSQAPTTDAVARSQIVNPALKALAAEVNKHKEQPQKPPPDIEVNRLPSAQEIYDAIPKEGIDIRDLVKMFNVDGTNFHLFLELLKLIGDIKIEAWVKPASVIPSDAEVDKRYIEAKKPAIPRKLEKNQVVKSKLVGVPLVTWKKRDELVRGASNIRPSKVYRVIHEDSATLSHFTGNLKLGEGNAFQAIAPFSGEHDLTRPRIERHLVWNKKKNESAYVSTFNRIEDAERRLKFHSRENSALLRQSERVGERLAVAVIDTSDLVPATVRTEIEEEIETIVTVTKGLFKWKTPIKSDNQKRRVKIPIWVHKSAFVGHEDAHQSHSNNSKQQERICGSLLRNFDAAVLTSPLPRAIIMNGLPILHDAGGKHPVRSKHSASENCWIWNWEKSRWYLDDDWERGKDGEVPGQSSTHMIEDRAASSSEDDYRFEINEDTVAYHEGTHPDDSRDDTPRNSKRKTNSFDGGSKGKRARLASTKSAMDTAACAHECSDWCLRGFSDEEARYAAAWTAIVDSENQRRIG